MLSQTVLFSLSFASIALAQRPGAGRFLCNTVSPFGINSANQALCTTPVPTGAQTGVPSTSYKSDGFTPIGSTCTLDPNGSGNFFCGFEGAPCDSTKINPATSNCDNGICTAVLAGPVGICTGSFVDTCTADTDCLGFIYCTTSFGAAASGTCGGLNSYCQDPFLAGNPDPIAQAAAFDATCASTYCNPANAQCANRVALAGDCTADSLSCVAGATCVNNVCTATAVPSGVPGARMRRNLQRRSNLCPESQTACSITGSTGFECIDTMTNLEQCGSCATNGGLDCTMLPGVDAVGCVSGACEIWACAAGFAYDSHSNSCLIALLA